MLLLVDSTRPTVDGHDVHGASHHRQIRMDTHTQKEESVYTGKYPKTAGTEDKAGPTHTQKKKKKTGTQEVRSSIKTESEIKVEGARSHTYSSVPRCVKHPPLCSTPPAGFADVHQRRRLPSRLPELQQPLIAERRHQVPVAADKN